MRNLTFFSTSYTSLHVCAALAIRRLVHDPRYVPRLVFAATLPERDLCGLCRSQSSLCYALLTSCRSALSRCGCSFLPAVRPLFPFFSVSTASAATSLTSTCFVHALVLVSQLLRTAPVRPLRLLQRDIAFSSSSATAWLRAFGLNEVFARSRADPRVLRTLLHVLRVVWWSPSTTLSLPLRAARVEGRGQQARPTPRPVVAHEYPSRGLVEGLVAPELLLPSCSVVAVASLRLLQAPPFVEASLPRECVRTSLAHLPVGVLTCRLARDTGLLSPSRCLAESGVAGLRAHLSPEPK